MLNHFALRLILWVIRNNLTLIISALPNTTLTLLVSGSDFFPCFFLRLDLRYRYIYICAIKKMYYSKFYSVNMKWLFTLSKYPFQLALGIKIVVE